MSTYFTGITFAEQKVTPSDDAIIRRSMLSDGILTGCAVSYSGSTLTMAAGYLLICGRQIRHPAAQNWAVVDASSGYARLLLTIDLTRTATKETFDQVVDTIEYASAEDGFPDLEQGDINESGTRYQVEICKVSLGTGGISGIVSQLQPCETSGGGGVNFKVVGGLIQPSDPKDNDIWINTDTAITGWVFSATEPEAPTEGMVWIFTGDSSPVAFSATKKNPVMVYPISAKQYVGGAWVDKTAKSFQNGDWVDWWNGYWFESGSEPAVKWVGLASATSSVDITTDHIKLNCPQGGFALAYTEEVVDLKRFKTLNFEHEGRCFIGVASAVNSHSSVSWIAHKETATNNGRVVESVDISAVDSGYLVVQSQYGPYTYNVWGE